jgi:hypothetical protein
MVHLLEIWRIELHCLREIVFSQLLLHKFIDIGIHSTFLLLIWDIVSVSLPTALLLLLLLIRISLNVLTLQTPTVLPTKDSFFETEAILLLAMRFFTCTKDQVLHRRLISVDLFEIVHVFDILLLD